MKDEWRKPRYTFLSEKKQIWKCHTLYGSNYVTSCKRERGEGRQGLATTKSRESNQAQIMGDLKTVEVPACLYNDRHISSHTCSNLQVIQTPRKELDFGVIVMSQCSWPIAGILSVRCWQWRGLCPVGAEGIMGSLRVTSINVRLTVKYDI